MLLGCPTPPVSGEESEDLWKSRAEGKGAAESQERGAPAGGEGAAKKGPLLACSPPGASPGGREGAPTREGEEGPLERAAAGTMHFNTDALHALLSKRRFVRNTKPEIVKSETRNPKPEIVNPESKAIGVVS